VLWVKYSSFVTTECILGPVNISAEGILSPCSNQRILNVTECAAGFIPGDISGSDLHEGAITCSGKKSKRNIKSLLAGVLDSNF